MVVVFRFTSIYRSSSSPGNEILGFLDYVSEFSHTAKLNDIGTFSFNVALDANSRALCVPDNCIYVDSMTSGIIESVTIDVDNNRIQVSGVTLEAVLSWKMAYPLKRILPTDYGTSTILSAGHNIPTTSSQESISSLRVDFSRETVNNVVTNLFSYLGYVDESLIDTIPTSADMGVVNLAGYSILQALQIILRKNGVPARFYFEVTSLPSLAPMGCHVKFHLDLIDYSHYRNIREEDDGVSDVCLTLSAKDRHDSVVSIWDVGFYKASYNSPWRNWRCYPISELNVQPLNLMNREYIRECAVSNANSTTTTGSQFDPTCQSVVAEMRASAYYDLKPQTQDVEFSYRSSEFLPVGSYIQFYSVRLGLRDNWYLSEVQTVLEDQEKAYIFSCSKEYVKEVL